MAKRKITFKMNSAFVTALAYIVVGVLFCIFKGSVMNWLMTALGILFIVQGVLDVVAGLRINGIVEIVIGALCIVFGWAFVTIALIVLGAVIIANGVIGLLKNRGFMSILINCLAIVFGILLIVNKWAVLDWLYYVIGALCIIDGVLMLFGKRI